MLTTTLSKSTIATGLLTSLYLLVVCNFGISVYHLAVTFKNDKAEQTAKTVFAILWVFQLIALIAIFYFAYFLGYSTHTNISSKSNTNENINENININQSNIQSNTNNKQMDELKFIDKFQSQHIDKLLNGALGTGIAISILAGIAAGFTYFGIFNNVSEWKTTDQTDNEDSTSGSSDMATILADISITLFSIGCFSILLYIGLIIIKYKTSLASFIKPK